MRTIDTPTFQLASLASNLFGDEWAGAVSRFTGINLRSCQRAKAAAATDEEDRRAAAILQALILRLDELNPEIQEAFESLEEAPNPFSATPLKQHAGVAITMNAATRHRLYELLFRAADYRNSFLDETLLLALAYDLRKAREHQLMIAKQPVENPDVTVHALWPLLLFQLKLLRATCAYLATSASEVALVDQLEEATFSALFKAYRFPDDAQNVIDAWHELGVDPTNPNFDERASARAAWFLNEKTARRREALCFLLESMTDLYEALETDDDDGRPATKELEKWNDRWPDKEF